MFDSLKMNYGQETYLYRFRRGDIPLQKESKFFPKFYPASGRVKIQEIKEVF
jgi:hypothetical protein